MAQTELIYKGFTGSVEPSIEDACLYGRIRFVDDLVTYEGKTIDEIRAAFQEAVDRYLAHCERVGKSPNKPYSGTFNVRIGSELHSKAVKVAHQKDINLNEFVKQAIQLAVDTAGVVTHKHRHEHNHNITVVVERTGSWEPQLTGDLPKEWGESFATKH